MRRAILVSGNEKCFVEATERMGDYLRKEAGISDIEIINTGEPEVNLADALQEVLSERRGDAMILFVYSGHGVSGSWCYSKSKYFPYSQLAKLLHRAERPILFINDCCYGFSVVDELKRYEWRASVGLIAASPADSPAFSFTGEAIESWTAGKVYDPKDYPYYVINLTEARLETIEVVVGGWRALWRHKLSVLLHSLAPKYFPVVPLTIIDTLPNVEATQEEIEKEIEAENAPHFHDRPRWGSPLDDHFFSRQLRLEFL